MAEAIRLVACGGAFAVAWGSFERHSGRGCARFIIGLNLAAGFSFAGHGLLFSSPEPDPSRPFLFLGASLLFVPLGVLVVAPFREALAALPLALATARLGCLPFACCYEAAWHALPELAGLVALHFAARRWPGETAAIVLSGFGALRLVSLPLRADPVAEPFVDPAWVAGGWVLAGVALRRRVGSARDAREWFTRRSDPMLRALVLMLLVWLAFPLSGWAFGDEGLATWVASSAALVLVVSLRPSLPRVSLTSLARCAGACGVGWGIAAIAHPASPPDRDALVILAAVLVAPVFEELLYRERLLGVLRTHCPASVALLSSSALFTLGHADPQVMPVAFAGGLVCGAVLLRTGSLATVIGLHAGWNLGVLL